jgi:FkbM family methyltransferase
MTLVDRLRERARRSRPDRLVRRDVQGVTLALPWSHRLPDYALEFPAYGQNLVAVARVVGDVEREPFVVVDVGANVGDSALQILAAVDARILCVEGDPYWLRFLELNVRNDSRVTVEPGLVLPDHAGATEAVRARGTTRFVASDAPTGQRTVDAGTLRDRCADLGRVRLVKSDTDGYDTRIVPTLARAWSDEHPVLFFEYDPPMSRGAGDPDPGAVWSELAASGYDRVYVWDNLGAALGEYPITEVAARAEVLELPVAERGYHYWDVAVLHSEDTALRSGLSVLVADAATTSRS